LEVGSAGAGTTVWRWDQQEPFGVNVPDENPSGLGVFELPLRLPGQYFDKETNLHYNYFRDYDPNIGKYVESDPIGLKGGLNTYAYVRDSPLRFVDPRGLVGWTGAIGGGGGHYGLGGAIYLFDFISDCACNKRVRVKGFISVVGAGLSLVDPSVVVVQLHLKDGNACPDGSAFNGPVTMASVGAAIYGCSIMTVGSTWGSHCGWMGGNEIGGSANVGASAVVKQTVECCN
jgi:RHS repeat-associated protein